MIVSGPMRDEALERLRGLAAALEGPCPPFSAHTGPRGGPGLVQGDAGVALFYEYLRRSGLPLDSNRGLAVHMERAIEGAAELALGPALDEGLPGIAWMMEHVSEPGPEDPCEDVDPLLLQVLSRTPWTHSYDGATGLVGLALYALERMARPLGRALLQRAVEQLAALAERGPLGAFWRTQPGQLPPELAARHPRGVVNLGLAHGVPSVLVVLSGACHHGVAPALAKPLLDEGVRYLLAQADFAAPSPRYCDWWDGTEAVRGMGHYGWCYGDPGVASALSVCAERVGNSAWAAQALQLGLAAADHRPEIHDSILCHGTGGLLQMFNRLYQRTGHPRLKEAALYWFERTLRLHQPAHPLGGFPAYRPWERPDAPFFADPSLLVGSAGVGLALLAAVTPLEPRWDSLMFLSA